MLQRRLLCLLQCRMHHQVLIECKNRETGALFFLMIIYNNVNIPQDYKYFLQFYIDLKRDFEVAN